ncbi:hypothetical protein L1887_36520 [Cichorium endivia]|nr:hypothetical protein L1887_36520 [Cichorium endivia]
MLSSSSSNPKPSSNLLYATMNLNPNSPSSSSKKNPNLLPVFTNPKISYINCKGLSQGVTISNGLSSSSSSVAANPDSISGSFHLGWMITSIFLHQIPKWNPKIHPMKQKIKILSLSRTNSGGYIENRSFITNRSRMVVRVLVQIRSSFDFKSI